MKDRLIYVFATVFVAFFALLSEPAVASAESKSLPDDGVILSPDAVNTGLDNGYSEDNPIEKDDPHFGWSLGYFYVTGQSQVTKNASGDSLVLKNTGDEVKLWFHLDEDINELNGDSKLTIADDSNGYDQRMGVKQTDLGRGTLIIKHIDSQNQKKDAAPYTDFLAAKTSKNANTMVEVFEEGDYEVALDYELLKDTHEPQAEVGPVKIDIDTPLTKHYTNYRIFFKFSVRNADCVVYPRDAKTQSELANSSYTEDGFYLDTAKSKYLDINVKRDVLRDGVDGTVFETKMNARVDGNSEKTYKDEGIYTITAHNPETKLDTTKIIYVGPNSLYKTCAETGKTVEEVLETQAQIDEAALEDEAYAAMVDQLSERGLYVEDIKVTYLSKEYLENLEYNSRENIYYGYLLSDIEAGLIDEQYVFSLSDDGETVVQSFEDYDDTYDRIASNVAKGTGVIVVCAAVSALAPVAGAPLAVTAVFTFAAKGALIGSVSGAVIGGTVGTVMEYVSTGDPAKALKAGALQASEDYKWGAITGAITGGVKEVSELRKIRKISKFELTMSEAAELQKAKVPNCIIQNMNSMKEYDIYKDAGLVAKRMPDGSWGYLRDIDLTTPIDGKTNAQRIREGLAPLDPNGKAYELHHIGQKADSPLAILTKAEHTGEGNHKILHPETVSEVERGYEWTKQRRAFWKEYLKMAQEAGKV